MARDATDTRETLLRTAQQMFARDGIHQVPLKRIVETAGQRNASALHYHFGGRDGLLVAITERHDGAIEDERAELLSELAAAGKLDDPARAREALVIRFANKLIRPTGGSTCASSSSSSGSSTSGTSKSPEDRRAQQVLLHIQSGLGHLVPPVRHERSSHLARARVRDPGHAGPRAGGRPRTGARSRRLRHQPRRHGGRRASARAPVTHLLRRGSRAPRRQGRAPHRGRGHGYRIRDREALHGRGSARRRQRQARTAARRSGRGARCSRCPVRRHPGGRRASAVRRCGVGARWDRRVGEQRGHGWHCPAARDDRRPMVHRARRHAQRHVPVHPRRAQPHVRAGVRGDRQQRVGHRLARASRPGALQRPRPA